ncbi:MAG: hypothetical protein GXP28_10435 [Planctomycetes bacterium]|nr:hypothetical protein [Planctomycetota bacterium]
MRVIAWFTMALFAVASTAAISSGAELKKYLLQSLLSAGETASVSLDLEVGGEMLFRGDTETKRLPVSVTGRLSYHQQIVAWSADPAEIARSLRNYQTASATIGVQKNRIERTLPAEQRILVAELRDGQASLAGIAGPLTREQYDLVNVTGSSLAIDRLLPGREVAEGENWDHDKAVLGALLGMDHVAVCEVSSVIIGQAHHQVQIRMAGTVHGTIDGASTEIQLRAAYLFHQQRRRITKFNMAVQEKRAAGEVVPGLDVVAKVRLVVGPTSGKTSFDKKLVQKVSEVSKPLEHKLLYDAQELGFRFLHDTAWYVTAEQRDLLSLRCLQEGDLTAHCNVSTLPARSAGRQTTLEQFERDIRESLGDHLESVTASTQWKTAHGHDCLGIIALGKFEEVPVQWRYYLLAGDGLPRVSLSVTLEQSQIERFADADRQIIETLELVPRPIAKTASRKK